MRLWGKHVTDHAADADSGGGGSRCDPGITASRPFRAGQSDPMPGLADGRTAFSNEFAVIAQP